MGKKRKKQNYTRETPPEQILSHIQHLRLASIRDYQKWCKEHYFPTGLNKSHSQLDREIGIYKQEEAVKVLKTSKKSQNLPNSIQNIYNKKLSHEEVKYNKILLNIYHAFKKTRQPKVLLDTLLYLEAESNLFRDAAFVSGVIQLTQNYEYWIRPLAEWRAKTHNMDRQFSSLARHLLAEYDVPIFMDQAFLSENSTQQKWFRHIGSGKNIRTAEKLPVPLTKKMAHSFLHAPDNYPIMAAFRWGQVHALGGDRWLANALLETKLVREFKDDSFWLSIIRFFIRHPMLDRAHVNPIVDYIWDQKYEDRMVFVERGVAENRGPAQPNFSMKGRTPESLLRQVNEWHRRLGKEAKSGDFQWIHSKIKDFEFIEGRKESKNMKIWRIRELVSSQELLAEGRIMRHCVATYARSCYTGKCTIWTMDLADHLGVNKRLTIELHPTSKVIRQVRGQNNRLPEEKEKSIIRRWAEKEDLKLPVP